MPEQLVIDTSTLVAFERAGLAALLRKLNAELLIPESVKAELESKKKSRMISAVTVVQINGRSVKKSRLLENTGIGRGEADCCALSLRLKLRLIICDDRKFLRQRFFCADKKLKSIAVFGFSFLLDLLFKEKIITDVWPMFEKIIDANNWRRSETEAANYTFLKERGY